MKLQFECKGDKLATYRHGARAGFWDGTTTFNQSTNPIGGVAVPAGATSKPVNAGRAADNFAFFITCSGAATFTLQAAMQGDFSSEGVWADESTPPATFFDFWYLGNSALGNSTPITLTFTTSASLATLVPDWEPMWCRLKRTDGGAAVTVTAGWEIQAD